MCGACGSGRVRAPWEESIGEPGPRGPARRAAVLTRLLGPWRWRVSAWAGGYTVAGPCGALPPASCVDEVIARAERARPGRLGPVGCGDDLALAEAVVGASVSALLGGPVVLAGPVRAPSTALAHGAVDIAVVPRAEPTWRVLAGQDAGPGTTARRSTSSASAAG